jgi:hypothetical protein
MTDELLGATAPRLPSSMEMKTMPKVLINDDIVAACEAARKRPVADAVRSPGFIFGSMSGSFRSAMNATTTRRRTTFGAAASLRG